MTVDTCGHVAPVGLRDWGAQEVSGVVAGCFRRHVGAFGFAVQQRGTWSSLGMPAA
jgi:hypothetical protein